MTPAARSAAPAAFASARTDPALACSGAGRGRRRPRQDPDLAALLVDARRRAPAGPPQAPRERAQLLRPGDVVAEEDHAGRAAPAQRGADVVRAASVPAKRSTISCPTCWRSVSLSTAAVAPAGRRRPGRRGPCARPAALAAVRERAGDGAEHERRERGEQQVAAAAGDQRAAVGRVAAASARARPRPRRGGRSRAPRSRPGRGRCGRAARARCGRTRSRRASRPSRATACARTPAHARSASPGWSSGT